VLALKINPDAYSYVMSNFEKFPLSKTYIVLGGVDVGKTSFSIALSFHLLQKGYNVFFLDLDLGQSTIGLPMTIALGRLTSSFEEGSVGVDGINLEFIGSTTPSGFEPLLLTRMYKLLSLVPEDSRLVIDTCGFIHSSRALGYKRMITEILPDVLSIVISKELWTKRLFPYIPGKKTMAYRLPEAKQRDPQVRKERRESLLRGYFSQNLTLFMASSDICYFPYPFLSLRECLTDENNMLKYIRKVDELLGVIVGLRDEGNRFMGLGRIVDIRDFELVIEAPISSSKEISLVELSRIRLDDQYRELGKISILEKEE
jgi:polynucleotide 5'-hydroxyl-kinase GRC3/NOL9